MYEVIKIIRTKRAFEYYRWDFGQGITEDDDISGGGVVTMFRKRNVIFARRNIVCLKGA